MNVITNLREKRRTKQISFERSVLKDLRITPLREQFKNIFDELIISDRQHKRAREDYCLELAVESYLLGARYSRFAYFGEPIEKVQTRSEKEKDWLTYLFYSSVYGRKEDIKKEFYQHCENFLSNCWLDGYQKGERRYRLRLR
jgi:hypothetical protein